MVLPVVMTSSNSAMLAPDRSPVTSNALCRFFFLVFALSPAWAEVLSLRLQRFSSSGILSRLAGARIISTA